VIGVILSIDKANTLPTLICSHCNSIATLPSEKLRIGMCDNTNQLAHINDADFLNNFEFHSLLSKLTRKKPL
jgi:hypothetical protein